MNAMSFTSTRVDTDVDIWKNTSNWKSSYYPSISLCWWHFTLEQEFNEGVTKSLKEAFCLKDEYGPPKIYLGAGVENFQLTISQMAWSMTSTKFMKAVVKSVYNMLAEKGQDLKTGAREH